MDIALVTGGSSGLGFALAEELLKKNIPVCIVSRRKEKVRKAYEKLKEAYQTEVFYKYGNIAEEEFVHTLYTSLAEENKRVVYLFNCAGEGKFGSITENTREKIDETFASCLIGLILMSTYAVKYMKDMGGMIINILSTAALKGNKGESIYCAAKWGARGFIESLKTEVKGSNIHVVSVFPGGMKTHFWNESCGASPDTTHFMDPLEVAKEIVGAVLEKKSMYVSELIIERK